jgi:cell pole-organizing protein PopZ
MSQPAKAQEPSMEEILASIRRIIADDDESAAPGKAANGHPPPPAAPAMRIAPPESPPPAAMAAKAAPLPRPAPPAHTPSALAMPDDILDLGMPSPAPPAPRAEPASFRTIDGRPDVVFNAPAQPASPEQSVAAEPAALAEARRQFVRTTAPDRTMLSPSTTEAVDSAFNALAQTVLVQNSQTLDGLVREMLRPMLKSWLDDNLPNLVERLVRAEIERVARGR